MTEPNDFSPVQPLAPAAPGQRSTLELAARIMSVVMVGWLCALAVFSWIGYGEGVVDMLLPIWNSVFVIGTLPVVAGVFSRRLWAQRWVVGISMFTALGNAWQASKVDSMLLWFGAALLAAVVFTLSRAKPLFNDSDGNRGVVQQVIATIVTIGSVVVSLQTFDGTGTERGRTMFAAEVQQAYSKGGATTVRVYVENLDLVIESTTDTDPQIDSAADLLHGELVTAGQNAKAWAVGFKHIVVTNGTYRRTLSPGDPP
jgi:hypothetical protein